MRNLIAFLLLAISSNVYASDICDEMKNGQEQGERWFKIRVPGNIGGVFYRPESREKQLFLSIDIDNDGDVEQVAEFYGGTQGVPYLVIWNEGKVEKFSSDRCGAGATESMDIVSTGQKNYVFVSIIEKAQDDVDCGISGYLTEYDLASEYLPGRFYGKKFFCSISHP